MVMFMIIIRKGYEFSNNFACNLYGGLEALGVHGEVSEFADPELCDVMNRGCPLHFFAEG